MVAVVLRRVDGVARDVRIRVGAVTDRPTALAEAEQAVEGAAVTAASAREAGALAARAVDPPGSIHASAGLPPPPDRNARRASAAAGLGAGGMTEITLTVNGRVVVEEVEPRLLLTDFLRHRLGLTGTHVGCEHGVCGACTVRLDGVSVRACCLLAVQADGSVVETVESLAGDAMLSPLQDAFKRHHALQCGFCTPGILIAADDLLSRGDPSAARRSSTCSPATSAAAPATPRSSPRSRTLVTIRHKRSEARR